MVVLSGFHAWLLCYDVLSDGVSSILESPSAEDSENKCAGEDGSIPKSDSHRGSSFRILHIANNGIRGELYVELHHQ